MSFYTNFYKSALFGLWILLGLSFNSAVFAKKLIDYTFEAAYQVALNNHNLGYTRISLTKADSAKNLFELQANAKTAGFIGFFSFNTLSEISQMQLTADGLRTLSYKYIHKSGNDVQDGYTINVNYTKQIATRIDRFPKTWKINSNLVSDRLSFSFMLADDFRRNKPLRNPMIILDGSHALRIKVKYVGSSKNKNITLRHYEFTDKNKSILDVSLNQKNRFIPYSIGFNNNNGDRLIYKLKSVVWTEIESL